MKGNQQNIDKNALSVIYMEYHQLTSTFLNRSKTDNTERIFIPRNCVS